MPLEKYISDLVEILKHEVRSFSVIQELLMLEEKSLVECDHEALSLLNQRQVDVYSSISCLEKSRMDILQKLAKLRECKIEDFTVAKLAELVELPLKKELINTGHLLSKLHEETKRRKNTNKILINQAILLLQSDVRLILNSVNCHDLNSSLYTANADSKEMNGSFCIDGKI